MYIFIITVRYVVCRLWNIIFPSEGISGLADRESKKEGEKTVNQGMISFLAHLAHRAM